MPVQVAPLNMMGNDAIRSVTVQKCTRWGYTKCMIMAQLYLAIHKKRTSAVYQPTDGDSKDFVVDEINSLFPHMPIVREYFPHWAVNDENNTLHKKVLNGATLHYKGADNANNFRRITLQSVIGDEVDAWKKVDKKEGNRLKLARERIRGAAFAKEIWGSTPTVEGQSIIEELMGEADAIFDFEVPCLHCKQQQTLIWGSKKTKFGIKWSSELGDTEQAKSVYYQCRHCSKVFYYNDLAKIQPQGRWITEEGLWTKDGIHYFTGKKVRAKTPRKIGVKCSALHSLTLTDGWAELVSEWLEINEDYHKLKSFTNLTLGELWVDLTAEKLSHEYLLERRESYQAEVPAEVVYLVGGIDTQDNRYEFYVWGAAPGESLYLIHRQIIMGHPASPETLATLEQALAKKYQHENGQMMEVGRWCWDTGGHHGDTVYDQSKKLGLLKFIPIKGASIYGKPIQNMPKSVKAHCKHTFLTEVGTDTAKEIIYHRLKMSKNPEGITPGFIHLPEDDAICPEEVCQQLVSEIKKLVFKNGMKTFQWSAEGRRNEALDCLVYALAALRISIERFGLDLNALAEMNHQSEKSTHHSFAELGRQLGT